jgi:hypothetical protein
MFFKNVPVCVFFRELITQLESSLISYLVLCRIGMFIIELRQIFTVKATQYSKENYKISVETLVRS